MSKIRLDHDTLLIGDREYFYEDNESYDSDEDDELEKLYWFRPSKKYYVSAETSDSDGRKKLTSDDVAELQLGGGEIMRARVRIRNPKKIKKLNRILEKEQEKAKAREKEERRRALEESDESEDSDESHQSEEKESEERGEGESEDKRKSARSPERTKWGIRVYSIDGKHFFGFGIWKSKKYKGCISVLLLVAGGKYLYTLDETQWEAFLGEVSRARPK